MDTRGFLSALTSARSRCHRSGGVVTVILLDPDRFHEVNDRYSPEFGNETLASVRLRFRQSTPAGAYFGAHASDQFIGILEDADPEAGVGFADACRRSIIDEPLCVQGRFVPMTISAGVIESSPGCPESVHRLMQRARIALRYAKDQGGNRVSTWDLVLRDPLVSGARAMPERLNAAHWRARLRQHVRSAHMESMRALVAAVDARDSYTKAHSQTVAYLAERIGRAMDFRGARLEALTTAGLLHDLGKIGVPDAILTKPGPLTREEFETIKRHPQTALDILGSVSFLSDVNPFILHHHERFDGTGYPAGLKGGEIPIGARIIAVADALDTMLSPRTYKAAYTEDRARAELLACAGTQFDAQVVSVAIRELAASK